MLNLSFKFNKKEIYSSVIVALNIHQFPSTLHTYTLPVVFTRIFLQRLVIYYLL